MVQRHSLLTRAAHWTNALAMGILLMSGLQILNAHPSLYWGQTGFEPQTAWFNIASSEESPPQGVLQIGRTVFHTTGVLGVVQSGGHAVKKAFPDWLTIPRYRDLGAGRRWHFFFAWILVVNGLIYLIATVLTGHLKRDLLPRFGELAPKQLAAQLWSRLRLRLPKRGSANSYNSLQKLSYLAVIFGLGPLIVLSGLTMSPGLNAAMPFLVDLFGGRQSARSIHFIAANLLVLFFLAHIAALIAAGVWNELRSMITGRYRVEHAE
jgi:thiosulfate reductase cytochrome b subunit